MDKTLAFGIIAFAALFVAGCISQGAQNATATPQVGVSPTPASSSHAISDVQVNAAISDSDSAIAEMDNVTSDLSDINSQDVNASVVDSAG